MGVESVLKEGKKHNNKVCDEIILSGLLQV